MKIYQAKGLNAVFFKTYLLRRGPKCQRSLGDGKAFLPAPFFSLHSALIRKAGSVIIAAVALLNGASAIGQVEIGLTVTPARALLYEPIRATVVIHNNTGGILNFDAGQGSPRFFFEVERHKHETIKLTDRRPLLFGLKLVSSGSATNVFNLTSLYTLQPRGLYKVKAYLEWNNVLFASQPVDLEMLKGFEIARMIAGVPGEEGTMRVYILEYLTRQTGEQLYLRIEDANSRTVYGMHKLGHIVRVRKPEMKVDESGNMHILFQAMSMIFVHTAFTPYGVQLFSREYPDRSNRICLNSLPSGRVTVSPLQPTEQKTTGNIPLPHDSSATQSVPAKARLGRGGFFGPK
ncbi:MAG: hypothetical protein Q7J98_11765 [Kiritimatiellia bacterium]|nr:hypothetical protein [Kiritimatiellia bacterium]